jgi:hypothetical protein
MSSRLVRLLAAITSTAVVPVALVALSTVPSSATKVTAQWAGCAHPRVYGPSVVVTDAGLGRRKQPRAQSNSPHCASAGAPRSDGP